MKQALGQPVEGEDFFDRISERRLAWRKLDTSSLLMLAPRRVGKTSLMLALISEAEDNGFHATRLTSFAACRDELDCVKHLLKALSEHSGAKQLFETLAKRFERVKGVKIAGMQIEIEANGRELWREAGEGITAALAQQEHPWLVCIDEVPVFLITLLKSENGRERAAAFLNWFRDLRQTHHRQVRWILAGSIGMDTIAARMHLGDTINDLHPFPLGAFDPSTARQFLGELADAYALPLDDAVRQTIVERIGWPLPYYLQLMFGQLLDIHDCGEGNSAVVPDDIERAFQALLEPAYKVHFDYWRQRLHEELDAGDAGHAIALLNIACRDPDGVSRDTLTQGLSPRVEDTDRRGELLRYLLDVLESDGYLHELDGRYRFRLAWLREYWLRRIAP